VTSGRSFLVTAGRFLIGLGAGLAAPVTFLILGTTGVLAKVEASLSPELLLMCIGIAMTAGAGVWLYKADPPERRRAAFWCVSGLAVLFFIAGFVSQVYFVGVATVAWLGSIFLVFAGGANIWPKLFGSALGEAALTTASLMLCAGALGYLALRLRVPPKP
jgi:hypothetical protein